LDGRNDTRDYDRKFRRFAILLAIPFVLLVVRLWYLQIWRGEHYAQRAFANVIDHTPLPAERGLILDNQGRVIAENRPAYNVALKPAFFDPPKGDEDAFEARLQLLKRYLALTDARTEKLRKDIHAKQGLQRHKALLVKRGITRDQVAVILSNQLQLPGVEVQAVSQRHYPFNDLAAHVIGYVNEVDGNELAGNLERTGLRDFGYLPGEMIGRSGIARAYESVLRGAPGLHASVVNSRRIPQTDPDSLALLGNWMDVEPISGKNVVLTIDMDLQRILKEAMSDYPSGAAVAIDPKSGRILGIASAPSFNPNSWSGRLSRDEMRENRNNVYKPMLDKALLAQFPGSTYKVVTSIAALDMGLIQHHETLECPGYFAYGKRNRPFHCWKRSGHEKVDLAAALQKSCDVYFYKLGDKIGMDKLAEYARMFGFGTSTGVGINRESPGRVPTKRWYREYHPNGFQGGYTLSTAIGQGDVMTSPLQMALAYGALANGGILYKPLLVDRIETAEGQVLFEYPARERSRLKIAPEHLQEIVRGLEMVVNDEGGTAYKVNNHLNYLRVAGKTGTAQVTSRIEGKDAEWHRRDHAWFAAFAPVEDPQIVVAVFLEHGGGGSTDAAPVAMEILDRYFREIRHVDPLQAQPDEPKPLFFEQLRPGTNNGSRQMLGGIKENTPGFR